MLAMSNAKRRIVKDLDVIALFTHTRDHGQTTIYKGTKGIVSRICATLTDDSVAAVAIFWGMDTCETFYTGEEAAILLAAFATVEKWGTGRNRMRRVAVDTGYHLSVKG